VGQDVEHGEHGDENMGEGGDRRGVPPCFFQTGSDEISGNVPSVPGFPGFPGFVPGFPVSPVSRFSYLEKSWQHASTMKCGLINYPHDQGKYTKQNSGENDGQRPEGPQEMSFSDVLYGVVQ
jgi:hypothetical protein